MDNPVHHINELPLEVLSKILSYLKFSDRQTASEVCTTWYAAAQDRQFLESTFVRLAADEHDWETLGGICKRRIPNLKIVFGTGDEAAANISPEIVHHSELVQCVKYLHLDGDFNARQVIFCTRHFLDLKTLRLGVHSYTEDRFFGEEEMIDRDPLSSALDRLSHLICELHDPAYEEEITGLFACFTGVENLSVTNAVSSYDHLDPHPPPHEPFILWVLEVFASHLQELDLRWCYFPHECFKDLLSISDLRLHTLRFKSCDGEGANLRILAYSPLCPKTVEVLCQYPENFEVGYSAISNLLAKKPCLEVFDCSGIEFYKDEDDVFELTEGCLEKVIQEWSNLDEVIIQGLSMSGMVPELSFHYGDNRRALKVELASVDIVRGTIRRLAIHNPRLRALTLVPGGIDGSPRGYFPVPVIVDSFPHLTKMVLFHCDLGGSSSIWRLATLETLCLTDCRGLTDSNPVDHHLRKLKHLKLKDCSELTDRAVISVVSSNPPLWLLDLSGCAQVTDRSIAAVAGHMKHLRCLLLVNCQGVTGRSAITIIEGCHMLQMVDATGCERSFVDALQRQKLRLPYLGSIKTKTKSEDSFMDFDYWSADPSSDYVM